MNAGLPRFASVKRFTILPRDFSEAEGELTPSQKVKRKAVEQRYQAGAGRDVPRGPAGAVAASLDSSPPAAALRSG